MRTRSENIRLLKKEQGSGLMIAIIMSVILIAVAVFLLSKIIPFARTVQGMEDSLQSKYAVTTGLEKGLLSFHFQDSSIPKTHRVLLNNPYSNVNFHSESDEPYPPSSKYFVKSLTKKIPLMYEGWHYGEVGDDNDKNRIFPGESIRLNLTGVQQPSELKNITFRFNVPNDEILTPSDCNNGSTDCNEQLLSITASGVEPNYQQVLVFTVEPNTALESKKNEWIFALHQSEFIGYTTNGEKMTLREFFDSTVLCDQLCTLEVRLLGDIGDNQYLLYDIGTQTFIPDVRALIVSKGESSGYAHDFYGQIPQKSYLSGVNIATQ